LRDLSAANGGVVVEEEEEEEGQESTASARVQAAMAAGKSPGWAVLPFLLMMHRECLACLASSIHPSIHRSIHRFWTGPVVT